ncbi:thiol reductant ABC exporter subunit CydD [Nocardia mangyaensis]|uniref:thiol reductant ABC exporter subunit CydD n=1 Tax=Nocardia mangyaensis TaxID=2213200 RepID=UPI002676A2CA|nr:thiol reductant ABC exporter subunit CydD [Nocardia mangyaensis]MDO3650205.1 thiol reductant ABC exporter subunit CydD [Nocardia mangyaensis]
MVSAKRRSAAGRRPVDPRLWRYARAARPHLVVAVALALVITATIVVIALMLGRVLAGVITDPDTREFGAWTVELVTLAVAVVVRAVASWWQARLAHRAGSVVVAELENAVLRSGAELTPRELDARRTEIAVVVGNGLNGLRGWFTGYLPALLLACLVPPVVLVVIALHDRTSALIAVITVPLIPLFMVLIGLLTQGRAEATLAATTRLSDQILDLFAGMPTLRALGREGGPGPGMADQVRALGDSLRRRTMRALRIAFLSSMVLESLATLSVALIAVTIGLRLVYDEMTLYAGLVALILAPEVYWPLRQVGEKFHAAQDGMAAAEKAFAVLEPARAEPVEAQADRRLADGAAAARADVSGVWSVVARGGRGSGPSNGSAATVDRGQGAGAASIDLGALPVVPGVRIALRAVTVRARTGTAPDRLTAELLPGLVTVLTGSNGCGKSTTLQAILGLIEPDAGAVLVDGVDVRDLDRDAWWRRIAWLPQRPVLVPGTLRENVELLGARADVESPGAPGLVDRIEKISAATGFDEVLDELPDRWDTIVGQGGTGLSLGQRQRLALTRVLAAHRPVLLLDEPTAHLDGASEHRVLTTLRSLAAAGATVVVIGHRPTVLAAADVIVEVEEHTDRDAPGDDDPPVDVSSASGRSAAGSGSPVAGDDVAGNRADMAGADQTGGCGADLDDSRGAGGTDTAPRGKDGGEALGTGEIDAVHSGAAGGVRGGWAS